VPKAVLLQTEHRSFLYVESKLQTAVHTLGGSVRPIVGAVINNNRRQSCLTIHQFLDADQAQARTNHSCLELVARESSLGEQTSWHLSVPRLQDMPIYRMLHLSCDDLHTQVAERWVAMARIPALKGN
jgi:hypothetical protein